VLFCIFLRIVEPLPPGTYPLAVNNNNNNKCLEPVVYHHGFCNYTNTAALQLVGFV
jgi:hypothetical protein